MSSFSPAIVSRKRLFRAFIDDTDSTVQSTQDELSSQDYGSPAIDEQPAGSHLQHDGSEIDPAPGGSRLRHDDSQIDWPETQQEGQTQIHTSTVLDELSAERNQQNLDPGDGQAPGSALLHDDDPQIDWRTTQTQCGLAEQDDEDDLEFETPTTPTFCYGIPKTIQDAHGSLTTCTTRMEPEYSAFVKQLCEETATRCVEAPLLLGVQYAIGKAISITLDQRLVDEPLIRYGIFGVAMGLILPCRSFDRWGKVQLRNRTLSLPVSLRCTVLGGRLVEKGGVKVWERAPWLRAVNGPDLGSPPSHDQTAEEYLQVLRLEGKLGLALRVIDKEIDGPPTPLRKYADASDIKEKKWAHSEIFAIFNAMDLELLKALIEGQLPRKAEIPFHQVWTALEQVNRPEITRPSIYMNSICDRMGISPTPAQWESVCEHMELYIRSDGNDLAATVDQLIHPSQNWPKDLARRNLRRYTEWRSWLNNEDSHPDVHHRKMVQYFASEMRKRIEGQARHVPLSSPVIEIGYSLNSHERLKQHARHRNSNYLMNLSEALLEHLFPGSFRLQQRIIYNCYRKEQTWLGEIVLTQLGQGYTEGARGFSHHPAGNSNGSAYRKTSPQDWDEYEAETCSEGDGRMWKELQMETEWVQRRNELAREEFELRKQKLLRLNDLIDSMIRFAQALP